MIKATRKTEKKDRPLTLDEALLQLKDANTKLEDQANRMKLMEEDNLAFQDFVLSTIGG